MGRRLRFFEPEKFYFVTARTFQGRLLLRPDPRVVATIGGVLARAAALNNVELYGFVALSNHVHLLCRARDGSLPSFMKHFRGNTSRKVAPLVGWRGQFWDRRYAAEPVMDDGAMEGRLRYILAHGVKEGLVSSPREWRGLSCLPQLLGEPKHKFPFYHWRKRRRTGGPDGRSEDRYSERLREDLLLELLPLPHWRDVPPEERIARVERMLTEIEHAYRHLKKVGVEKVLQKSPHSRPAPPKPRPLPWCHASDLEAWKAERDRYRAFAREYALASRRFRGGELTVAFPPGAFKPFLPPHHSR